MPPWVHQYSAALLVVFGGAVGVALTALTLPGIWFTIALAGLAQWWHMDHFQGRVMFNWWTLGACVALGLAAEAIELCASAAGAARAGGSKRGAALSILGAFFGAIVGTFLIPVPIAGTIVGAALGAGLAAIVGERWAGKTDWKQVGRIGAGAAAGRLAASIVKVGFAVVIAVILGVAAFV